MAVSVLMVIARAVELRLTGVLAVSLFICSGTASAQTVAEDLSSRLTNGSNVAVTDAQGREFKGRIVDITPEALTVATRREQTQVRYSEVVKIDRVDGLRNGALIGAAIGAGLFIADAVYSHENGISLNAPGYVVFAALYSGLGAGAGAGIDALIGGNRNIYQRGRAARISVVPMVRPNKTGAVIALSW